MDSGFAAPLQGAYRPVGRYRSAGAEHAPRNPGFAPRNDGRMGGVDFVLFRLACYLIAYAYGKANFFP